MAGEHIRPKFTPFFGDFFIFFRKLRTFSNRLNNYNKTCLGKSTMDRVFKGKHWNFVTMKNSFDSLVVEKIKKETPRVAWFWDTTICDDVDMHTVNIWIKRLWFTHFCRKFWKCWFYVFWGTFLNRQFQLGDKKALFSTLSWCTW